jgi:dTDP-4-dehydrorhamnose reductase
MSAGHPLEIWGGVECSLVRLGHGVYDQQARTGHWQRDDDLERFAELGLKTLRFPILWEHHHAGDPATWRRTDTRMQQLRDLGIRPIVGLLHHGCGPLPEGFMAHNFVTEFMRFAREVAERYPWVDAYTPVNEPLTTARFSGLYGLWHPCHRDERSMLSFHLRQCAAARAAMREIRQVNSSARLITTEDIGKTHSTPALAYQADFENERRWFTYDLLCGRVVPGNRMHAHMVYIGIPEDEIASFADEPCPPQLLGINYYVTSERMLDEHLDCYPQASHGGNGRHTYADVPAARVRAEGLVGLRVLLREMWERYQLPIAITEIQLACTRDEQLRWLMENWQAALAARAEGIAVEAMTAWALLGAYDWDSLLTRPEGHYECGAFDVSTGQRRKTVLADAIAALAAKGDFDHPVAHGAGWWRRPGRLTFPPVSAPATGPGTATSPGKEIVPPVVIVGANPQVAAVFEAACKLRALPALFVEREADLPRFHSKTGPGALIRPDRFASPTIAAERVEALVHHALDEWIDTLRTA